jgi:hypothetical protein
MPLDLPPFPASRSTPRLRQMSWGSMRSLRSSRICWVGVTGARRVESSGPGFPSLGTTSF